MGEGEFLAPMQTRSYAVELRLERSVDLRLAQLD